MLSVQQLSKTTRHGLSPGTVRDRDNGEGVRIQPDKAVAAMRTLSEEALCSTHESAHLLIIRRGGERRLHE